MGVGVGVGVGNGEWFPCPVTLSKIVACLAVAVFQGEFISFREIFGNAR